CVGHIFGRHTLTGISNAQHEKLTAEIDLASLDHMRFQLCSAAVICKFDGVREQVHKCADEQFPITPDYRQILQDLFVEPYLCLNCMGIDFSKSCPRYLSHIYRCALDGQSLCVELGKIEKVGHKAQNSLATLKTCLDQLFYQLVFDASPIQFQSKRL